ncbi:N-acetylgalactosamine 6-sulfate sulfatase [Rubritalea profundi]|uniref:N-acetylgalactosamine 6-sulfate sulfatase n=2 Tax=Rubritalea profundi TaxID=1658618 RepID=A0A2S7U7W7_9BACT|nr:N-acetylgalactosamine 6-sulfate sulfatase [Rubritalea profundi]
MKALSIFLLIALITVAHSKPKEMNVIFILADDLGWSDTTLYGQTKLYQTPNLEKLAARGMTFSNAYTNSPLCSPTRASVLTGQSPARHGSVNPAHHTPTIRLQASLRPNGPPGDKALKVNTVTRLDNKLPTLGKLFKQRNYQTAHFGKWHLGTAPYSPRQHGFDVDIPNHPGPGPAGSYVAPWRFKNFKPNSPNEHIEDRMAKEATSWLKKINKNQPFFMNYWQFSVHGPFNAKEKLIEKYKPLIKPGMKQNCPTYAAMVESMDDAIGTLLDAVDKAGIADNTIIIFISDNGGNMYSQVDNTTPTTNAPLRGGKACIFDGGTRVPCIVVWPGVSKAGSKSKERIQTSDFYPTLAKHLNLKIPKTHPVDGIDIMPAVKGEKLERQAIFTYFPTPPPVPDWLPPSIAVYSGDWKLIRVFHGGENQKHDYKLYNLKNDIGEKKNLTSQYPEKVKTLDAMIDQHIKETGAVIPVKNPKFDPAQYKPELIGIRPASKNKKKKRKK